jgi:AmmeMemoRadiSam system protein A
VTSEQGRALLALARASIAARFADAPPQPEASSEPWLQAPGATFVSLHQQGDLRGCVGNIKPLPTLYESVVRNARAAAFEDSRFPPLNEAELAKTQLEVTVLSPLERVAAVSEAEALAQLRPGQDGVVLNYQGRTSVFIPQMWEEIPDPREFLLHLKRKARFPAEWQPGMSIDRFTAEHWEES